MIADQDDFDDVAGWYLLNDDVKAGGKSIIAFAVVAVLVAICALVS